jgi:hypothetical protein
MMDNVIQLSQDEFEYLGKLNEGLKGAALTMANVQQMNQRAAAASGRRTPAQKYKDFMAAYDDMKDSGDPRVRRAFEQANLELKAVQPGTVHQNATLSNLSVQYANEEYIGTQLLPVISVAKASDTYYVYPQGERMQYPDDAMGTRGRATEIAETRNTATYTCLPYGLSNFVSQDTLNNQDAPLDEMVDLVAAINEGMAYNREQRIATVMTTGANFGTTSAVAAADRWDTTDGGTVIADMQTAMATLWMGRGPSTIKAFSSLDVLNALARNPQILDLFKYNGSSPGLATPDMIARFFGIDSYLIGKARSNTATEGVADVFARVWGDVFGVVRVATRASIRNASFGYTFRQGTPSTMVEYDQMAGHKGGHTAQVTVKETHNVVAAATGYLYTTPIG